jgi:hypothetical protein
MRSTKGRPRVISDAQVAAIMEWHRKRKRLRQVAEEVGLSVKRVQYVISREGRYKQPSPEHRDAVVEARRARLRTLAARGWCKRERGRGRWGPRPFSSSSRTRRVFVCLQQKKNKRKKRAGCLDRFEPITSCSLSMGAPRAFAA